jgi:hypothetical protein
MAETGLIRYHYRFRFPDGKESSYEILLGPDSLALTRPEREDLPDWTRLGFRQCDNCPLSEETHPAVPSPPIWST